MVVNTKGRILSLMCVQFEQASWRTTYDELICKVIEMVGEAMKLKMCGFEHVLEVLGVREFRKRK